MPKPPGFVPSCCPSSSPRGINDGRPQFPRVRRPAADRQGVRVQQSRMRQSRTSGSVGAPGGRLPGATRLFGKLRRNWSEYPKVVAKTEQLLRLAFSYKRIQLIGERIGREGLVSTERSPTRL